MGLILALCHSTGVNCRTELANWLRLLPIAATEQKRGKGCWWRPVAKMLLCYTHPQTHCLAPLVQLQVTSGKGLLTWAKPWQQDSSSRDIHLCTLILSRVRLLHSRLARLSPDRVAVSPVRATKDKADTGIKIQNFKDREVTLEICPTTSGSRQTYPGLTCTRRLC